MSGLHAQTFNVLAVLLVLHLIAIVFHVKVKKNNLLAPMLHGKKVVPKAHAIPYSKTGLRRFLLALLIASSVVFGVSYGVQILLPPPVVTSSPDF